MYPKAFSVYIVFPAHDTSSRTPAIPISSDSDDTQIVSKIHEQCFGKGSTHYKAYNRMRRLVSIQNFAIGMASLAKANPPFTFAA